MNILGYAIPAIERHNAQTRNRKLREWTLAKLDSIRRERGWASTELMELPDRFTEYWERYDDPEAFAVKTHDVDLLRELHPKIAAFIRPQKAKGKGKSAKSRKQKIYFDFKSTKVRVMAAAADVDEIKELWRHSVNPRPPIEIALEIAASRHKVRRASVREYRKRKSERTGS